VAKRSTWNDHPPPAGHLGAGPSIRRSPRSPGGSPWACSRPSRRVPRGTSNCGLHRAVPRETARRPSPFVREAVAPPPGTRRTHTGRHAEGGTPSGGSGGPRIESVGPRGAGVWSNRGRRLPVAPGPHRPLAGRLVSDRTRGHGAWTMEPRFRPGDPSARPPHPPTRSERRTHHRIAAAASDRDELPPVHDPRPLPAVSTRGRRTPARSGGCSTNCRATHVARRLVRGRSTGYGCGADPRAICRGRAERTVAQTETGGRISARPHDPGAARATSGSTTLRPHDRTRRSGRPRTSHPTPGAATRGRSPAARDRGRDGPPSASAPFGRRLAAPPGLARHRPVPRGVGSNVRSSETDRRPQGGASPRQRTARSGQLGAFVQVRGGSAHPGSGGGPRRALPDGRLRGGVLAPASVPVRHSAPRREVGPLGWPCRVLERAHPAPDHRRPPPPACSR
jgi:hypothetical protein